MWHSLKEEEVGWHQREGRGRRGALPDQERDVGHRCRLESIVPTRATVLSRVLEGNPVFSLDYKENSWLRCRLTLGGSFTIYF